MRQCTGDSFRETLAGLFDQPRDDGLGARGRRLDAGSARRRRPRRRRPRPGTPPCWQRLDHSVPRVQPGQATPTLHSAATLTAASGVVSTVRDLAKFDLALKQGLLLTPETLARAWSTPGRPRAPQGCRTGSAGSCSL